MVDRILGVFRLLSLRRVYEDYKACGFMVQGLGFRVNSLRLKPQKLNPPKLNPEPYASPKP